MRMLRAALRPARRKTVNQRAQALAFLSQIPFISDHKSLRRRCVPPHRGIVLEHSRLHQESEDPPGKHPRRKAVTDCPLHRGSAMRHRLCRAHLAPLSRRAWPKTPDPLLNLGCRCDVKQVLHMAPSLGPPISTNRQPEKYLCPILILRFHAQKITISRKI